MVRIAAAPLPDAKVPLVDGDIALRWFKRDDAAAIVEICLDPEIVRWTYMPDDLDVRSARAWIDRRQHARRFGRTASFAIVERASVGHDDGDGHDGRGRRGGALLGQCGVAVDRARNVGEAFYFVAAQARRRGVATRALCLVVRYAFETLALERVELKIDPANAASQGVAEASGFVYEGTLRADQPFKGRRMDSQIWSRLPSDPPLRAPG
jgi:RimJ/RimL family protein N-acetyltransferase